MNLSDLFFWTSADNNTGLENIRGDELAALIAATIPGANPNIGLGAQINRGAGQNISTGTPTTAIFTSEIFDDLGFADLGANNDRLTIPVTDPQITRVMLTAEASWQNNASGTRGHAVSFNGSSGFGDNLSFNRNRPPTNSLQNALFTYTTQLIPVVPGDFFGIKLEQDGAPSLQWRGYLTLVVLQ